VGFLGKPLDPPLAGKEMNILVLQRPFLFFAIFALATLLLLPLWNGLADWYMAALTALVNAASAWTGLPSQFQFGAMPQEQTVNPGIVAGTALFIATPERSVRWKISWIVFLIAFLYLFQSLMLLLQIHIAYAHFFAQLSWVQRLHYDVPMLSSLRTDSLLASLVESGRYWAKSLCFILIWIVAIGRR
jgi:hypothetical protein